MFEILRKSLKTGLVTTEYPDIPAELSIHARGRPEIDFKNWTDVRPATAACPTGALSYTDQGYQRTAALDLGKCTFCGLCAESDTAIAMTPQCELAARHREELKTTVCYRIKDDGSHESLLKVATGAAAVASNREAITQQLKSKVDQIFGRSLHVRQVDAGSCNGCETEIHGLNSPVYDVERLGLHFVASPRHADLLLVTGPVTRNMELALRKTYAATPTPRLVVAVGACGCSGGIFGVNYASLGGVDQVIPVDVYIPGCPPNPFALLHGILMAINKLTVEQ
jgi:Ni,Fe-hydrogenase III small subunit/formate hydrogenlyase subunit 6/NADH:ubiquinone oxidoreductase subunit I